MSSTSLNLVQALFIFLLVFSLSLLGYHLNLFIGINFKNTLIITSTSNNYNSPVRVDTKNYGWKPLYKKPPLNQTCASGCRVKENLPNTLESCPGNKPCIAIATAFFFTWKPWIEMITNECEFSCDYVRDVTQADAVLFNARDITKDTINQFRRHPDQFWVYLNMESPIATVEFGYNVKEDLRYRFFFNWTESFMRSSNIFSPHGDLLPHKTPIPADVKLVDKSWKTKFAYILNSNCLSFNKRKKALDALAKVIDIDFFGACYGKRLPLVMHRPNIFLNMSLPYHFYISFENSFCKDYITEKFFYNALSSSVIPVAFGGQSEDDYKAFLPPKSYIYGPGFRDFESLAAHLKYLVANETAYHEYFEWKRTRWVRSALREDRILCNLCKKLHTDSRRASSDLKDYYSLENCRNYTRHSL